MDFIFCEINVEADVLPDDLIEDMGKRLKALKYDKWIVPQFEKLI